MAAFSTTDQDIIQHRIELDPIATSATSARSGRSIEEVYEILSTSERILESKSKRVALQFPDEALVDSVPVYWALKRTIRSLSREVQEVNLYILADTSYGNCCVDEVAAQHVDADLVIHYGHSCLSPTSRLAVHYVFTKQPIDVSDAVASLKREILASFYPNGIASEEEGQERVVKGSTSSSSSVPSYPKCLVLTYDVSWYHSCQQVYLGLKAELERAGVKAPLVLTKVERGWDPTCKAGGIRTERGKENASNDCCRGGGGEGFDGCSSGSEGGGCDRIEPDLKPGSAEEVGIKEGTIRWTLGPCRSVELADPNLGPTDCHYLYLGPESLSLTNLLLRLGPSTPLVSYDPTKRRSRLETGRTNRLLMKRYHKVEQARDASVVGLLVGTLGIRSYLPLLSNLRTKLESNSSSRKVYTISVGKLNPAKLANFQEIDVFVLVACPENSLVDSKEFYKPIVTPFEMELALRRRGEEGEVWSGEYVLDLERLVGSEVEEVVEEEEEEEESPHFSLITGTYLSRTKYRNVVEPPESSETHPPLQGGDSNQLTNRPLLRSESDRTVAMRGSDGKVTKILETASKPHLERRGWKGLEQRLGFDPPSLLEEGKRGIAKGYAHADGQSEGDLVTRPSRA
ncbi:diphthamide biosynthesis protein [Violaceomyces palustris]|uniref:Diphthamide biosynthesis protein n=1 Tax=Violaceomyces palustris TaxID=1673888 RepID=A0ACD0NYB1_9BASI|nr:diphthamide biosynthesis protein [Violaceomyces palustris]